MVTQKIKTRLSNAELPPVRMVSGDVGREIQLEIYASEESTTPIDLETYLASITIIKPDNTFVIADFDSDKVELPEQAGAVTGHGYYQIKIYTSGDHQIYTGQGAFIVDDDILSEETIESIAEVNGYKFPDDFLTEADLREYVTKYELEDALAGIIDDDTTDYNSTWSSYKINEALANAGTTYSTAEHVVGKWIDGTTDVYEKTIVSEFTNHAENYTLDLSQMGGNAILPIDISPAVCIFTEGGGTYKQIVQPTATNQNINSISVYHGGATADTFKGYVTVRYIYL